MKIKEAMNCQAASTASGVIVSAYVTGSASDKEHLLPLMQQAESNTKQVSDTILAMAAATHLMISMKSSAN